MKTANDIYNATYHKDSYNAIRTAIDALKKPNSQERTNALIDIQDMARRLSEPFYATQELYADPILVKHWSALMGFGYDNGLSMDVIKDIRRYLNRFRAAALAESMVIRYEKTSGNNYLLTAPVQGELRYHHYLDTQVGMQVTPTLHLDTLGDDTLDIPLEERGYIYTADETAPVIDILNELPTIQYILTDLALVGLNLFTF